MRPVEEAAAARPSLWEEELGASPERAITQGVTWHHPRWAPSVRNQSKGMVMAEIPNALTDLLRGRTPDEIHETLYQKHCLSPAGIEQRGRAIVLVREADVEAQRQREHGMVGPTREYYIVGALMRGGYLNARANDLLDTITYQP